MGCDGGYELYDVGGVDWPRAKQRLGPILTRSKNLPGFMGKEWLAAALKGLKVAPSLQEWMNTPYGEGWPILGGRSVAYHGHLPWLAPNIRLVRVSWGDNVGNEADIASEVFGAIGTPLLSEETWS